MLTSIERLVTKGGCVQTLTERSSIRALGLSLFQSPFLERREGGSNSAFACVYRRVRFQTVATVCLFTYLSSWFQLAALRGVTIHEEKENKKKVNSEKAA